MRKSIFLMGILLICSVAYAQNLFNQPHAVANYELAARFSPKRVNKMVFSTSVTPIWFKNSDRFIYTYETPAGKNWYLVDAATGSKRLLFDPAVMAAQVTEIVKDPFDAQNLPIQNFKIKDETTVTFEITSTIDIEVKDETTGRARKEKKVFGFSYDFRNNRLTNIEGFEKEKTIPSWASFSPDGQMVVFSRNFDLYYMNRENFEKARKNDKDSTIVEHRITEDGIKFFGYGGGPTSLYPEKADIERRYPARIAWSPDGSGFALVKRDEREVKDFWVIDVLKQPRPVLENYKYHMPGEAEAPQNHLLVYSFKDSTFKAIKISAFKDQEIAISYEPILEKDRFDDIRPSKWLGTPERFYITRTSRDLKRIDICAVDIASDSVKVLVEERLNTYVETRPLQLVNNGREFIQWSERTGWAHLYLYDGEGNLKNAITSGPFHVERILGVDEATRTVFFTACGREQGINPYYQHLYKAKLDGTGITLLTPGDFTFSISPSDNNKYFIANYSRVNTAPQTALYNANGRVLAQLETADLSLLFEAGYKFPEPFTVKAGDGITDLYGVLYKPYDFDSTARYPIVQYVYPGPQTEATVYAWSRGMDRVDRLAQMGFVVMTVGNRGGHPNRSKWYHNYGYGNLRDYGLEDQKVAAERLAARHPFMDITRVGIHGHSGGGFMSTAAILTYTDFYKVAVSCAGNHENNIYNRWWSEKHHGVQENISDKGDTTFVYNIKKNSELAKNLKGRLLLIHGDIDNNVHPANTMRVVDALIRANKRFDMLILPGQRHGFGDMTEYFFWKMADYFSRYLLGDYRDSVDMAELNNN
ncbi:MAG: S9 family peptidase [Bacteroidales bacterium]|nr:S9 family peptidase [Bacteroidales bacterium]